MRLIEGEAHSLSQLDFASQREYTRTSRLSFGQRSASAAVQNRVREEPGLHTGEKIK